MFYEASIYDRRYLATQHMPCYLATQNLALTTVGVTIRHLCKTTVSTTADVSHTNIQVVIVQIHRKVPYLQKDLKKKNRHD